MPGLGSLARTHDHLEMSMDNKKTYEAPRVVAREDLKKITLYTGFNSERRGKQGPRDLFWQMP